MNGSRIKKIVAVQMLCSKAILNGLTGGVGQSSTFLVLPNPFAGCIQLPLLQQLQLLFGKSRKTLVNLQELHLLLLCRTGLLESSDHMFMSFLSSADCSAVLTLGFAVAFFTAAFRFDHLLDHCWFQKGIGSRFRFEQL